MGQYQRTPKKVGRALRYSGLGVRSVGPVGNFLDYIDSSLYIRYPSGNFNTQFIKGTFQDDVPFPCVRYVCSLEGILYSAAFYCNLHKLKWIFHQESPLEIFCLFLLCSKILSAIPVDILLILPYE